MQLCNPEACSQNIGNIHANRNLKLLLVSFAKSTRNIELLLQLVIGEVNILVMNYIVRAEFNTQCPFSAVGDQ